MQVSLLVLLLYRDNPHQICIAVIRRRNIRNMQRNPGGSFGEEPLSLIGAGEFVDDRLHIFKQRRIHFGQKTFLIQANDFAYIANPWHAINWIEFIAQNRVEIEERSLRQNLRIPRHPVILDV